MNMVHSCQPGLEYCQQVTEGTSRGSLQASKSTEYCVESPARILTSLREGPLYGTVSNCIFFLEHWGERTELRKAPICRS
jgi:hypothetical protein